LYAVIRSRANANKDESIRKYYFRAFYFKIFCVFAYAMFTEFYFNGGDTALYYQAILDFRTALADDFNHFSSIVTTSKLDQSNPMAP
jgi:hypothetical protein